MKFGLTAALNELGVDPLLQGGIVLAPFECTFHGPRNACRSTSVSVLALVARAAAREEHQAPPSVVASGGLDTGHGHDRRHRLDHWPGELGGRGTHEDRYAG